MGTIQTDSLKQQWLNYTLFFYNFMYKTKKKPEKNKFNDYIITDGRTMLKDNDMAIGGKEKNTIFLLNNSNFKTDFIKVNKEDLVKFVENRVNKNERRLMKDGAVFYPSSLTMDGDFKYEQNSYAEYENGILAEEKLGNRKFFSYFGYRIADLLRYVITRKTL